MVGVLKSSLCRTAGMNWFSFKISKRLYLTLTCDYRSRILDVNRIYYSLHKHGARNRTGDSNNYYDVSFTTATGGIQLMHPSSPVEQCDWTIIVQLPVKGKVH